MDLSSLILWELLAGASGFLGLKLLMGSYNGIHKTQTKCYHSLIKEHFHITFSIKSEDMKYIIMLTNGESQNGFKNRTNW